MELSQTWREQVTNPLETAAEKLSAASSEEDWREAEGLFVAIEEATRSLLAAHPEAVGKQPYEGEYRSSSAGRLLCGVMRCIQQLRSGEVSKSDARAEIQTLAVQLLNLRADHGRFFDTSLNQRINQVERMYQKIIQK